MHPLAWWAWALGLAVATTRSTSTVVTGLVLVTTVVVVLTCRTDTPWGRAFTGYLVLAGAVVVVRLAFHVVVGIKGPGRVLLDLPSIALPGWAAGVELLGPVTLPGVLIALAAGLRLAALIVCFGAANALANPKRALRSLPSSLHQLGTAVVIAVSAAPQLVASAAGVRRAQRLRGIDGRGVRVALATAVPVLADALDRSQALAASMDVRGYARTLPGSTDRRVGTLLATALLAAALGSYGLLDGASPSWMGVPVLVLGSLAAVLGTVLAGRRVRRSRYRPDPWRAQESVVAASGALATAALLTAGRGTTAPVGLLALGAVLALLPILVHRRSWTAWGVGA
ncbi:CbiQ family ECF transporter T component [Actinotalea sp.]|uniref:energy-coupling factor transporter transmembrane component T n=1 Tax=Actinotalea sp. TaxID=1872145 RepID=UPI002CB16449|nr:CbiQ family ECF transporter T component [Actinotalea sp.]HQY33938.1 CbiQ family ECF transporter T component [Actinotalea sp.]HRA49918.1 CbiQ family ECF transporter T component [Actinotalea sp.]